MTRRFIVVLALGLALFIPQAASAAGKTLPPNIVVFLTDDQGWQDVGYHGAEFKTPTIDKLAASGVRLEQFYAMPLCSPTRACLLTGRYPMRYGFQSGVIMPWSTYGLSVKERTLAQALREAGYRTAIVGKWHQGHANPAWLPRQRGFDHQYGQYIGQIDYFDHSRFGGLDWHRDDKPLQEEGYTTTLIGKEAIRIIETQKPTQPLFLYVAFNAPHAPLKAPKEYLERCKDIKDPERRTYAACVTCVDDTMNEILKALDKRGMRNNTLIIWSSDNGGEIKHGARNGELRNGKRSLYEGGVRVPACAVWPGKLKPGTIVNEPLHMVDWYPTLLKLAGASLKQPLPVDGKDIWPTIAEGKPSPHEDILFNVEPTAGAIRKGPWKLVVHGPLPGDMKSARIELYNLPADPSEKANLADKNAKVVKELWDRLEAYARQAVRPLAVDVEKQPKNFKGPKVYGE